MPRPLGLPADIKLWALPAVLVTIALGLAVAALVLRAAASAELGAAELPCTRAGVCDVSGGLEFVSASGEVTSTFTAADYKGAGLAVTSTASAHQPVAAPPATAAAVALMTRYTTFALRDPATGYFLGYFGSGCFAMYATVVEMFSWQDSTLVIANWSIRTEDEAQTPSWHPLALGLTGWVPVDNSAASRANTLVFAPEARPRDRVALRAAHDGGTTLGYLTPPQAGTQGGANPWSGSTCPALGFPLAFSTLPFGWEVFPITPFFRLRDDAGRYLATRLTQNDSGTGPNPAHILVPTDSEAEAALWEQNFGMPGLMLAGSRNVATVSGTANTDAGANSVWVAVMEDGAVIGSTTYSPAGAFLAALQFNDPDNFDATAMYEAAASDGLTPLNTSIWHPDATYEAALGHVSFGTGENTGYLTSHAYDAAVGGDTRAAIASTLTPTADSRWTAVFLATAPPFMPLPYGISTHFYVSPDPALTPPSTTSATDASGKIHSLAPPRVVNTAAFDFLASGSVVSEGPLRQPRWALSKSCLGAAEACVGGVAACASDACRRLHAATEAVRAQIPGAVLLTKASDLVDGTDVLIGTFEFGSRLSTAVAGDETIHWITTATAEDSTVVTVTDPSCACVHTLRAAASPGSGLGPYASEMEGTWIVVPKEASEVAVYSTHYAARWSTGTIYGTDFAPPYLDRAFLLTDDAGTLPTKETLPLAMGGNLHLNNDVPNPWTYQSSGHAGSVHLDAHRLGGPFFTMTYREPVGMVTGASADYSTVEATPCSAAALHFEPFNNGTYLGDPPLFATEEELAQFNAALAYLRQTYPNAGVVTNAAAVPDSLSRIGIFAPSFTGTDTATLDTSVKARIVASTRSWWVPAEIEPGYGFIYTTTTDGSREFLSQGPNDERQVSMSSAESTFAYISPHSGGGYYLRFTVNAIPRHQIDFDSGIGGCKSYVPFTDDVKPVYIEDHPFGAPYVRLHNGESGLDRTYLVHRSPAVSTVAQAWPYLVIDAANAEGDSASTAFILAVPTQDFFTGASIPYPTGPGTEAEAVENGEAWVNPAPASAPTFTENPSGTIFTTNFEDFSTKVLPGPSLQYDAAVAWLRRSFPGASLFYNFDDVVPQVGGAESRWAFVVPTFVDDGSPALDDDAPVAFAIASRSPNKVKLVPMDGSVDVWSDEIYTATNDPFAVVSARFAGGSWAPYWNIDGVPIYMNTVNFLSSMWSNLSLTHLYLEDHPFGPPYMRIHDGGVGDDRKYTTHGPATSGVVDGFVVRLVSANPGYDFDGGGTAFAIMPVTPGTLAGATIAYTAEVRAEVETTVWMPPFAGIIGGSTTAFFFVPVCEGGSAASSVLASCSGINAADAAAGACTGGAVVD